MIISHQLEGALPVAFPGAPGAYSEEAARRLFGTERCTLTCGTLLDAVRAAADGRAVAAVVPIENTITGPFAGVVDAIAEAQLGVAGEVVMPVNHCLLGLPGTRMDDVRVVASHSVALAHCRDWLASWGVATRAGNDTGEAARSLAESGDSGVAVIGGRALARIYGLEVLAESISDRNDNRTRFLALMTAPTQSDLGTRTSVLLGPLEAPRALKTLRIQLEASGARRVRVPLSGSDDGRHAIVEYDHPVGDGFPVFESACADIAWRHLGTWAPTG